MATPTATRLDPVTFEVVKHKIWAMVDEQAIALKSVSGSSVVTEANDFNVGLYTREGDVITVGRFILTQARTTASIIRGIVREYGENPGIQPGDMFICNDPWMGSLHPPDVSIAAPIFYEGELVAWAGCCAHQLDMGGMDFGSWCAGATERQQEAMILSAVKFMERGRIRKDIWNSIMNMSRLPFLVGLDFRAMIAANNLAIRRFTGLVERYGLQTVRDVIDELLETSEARMRQRLRELPDGVYQALDFLDHDGHEDRLYRVQLTLTKDGDRLDLDFTGSSPQAPGFINCTEAGLVAGVCAGLIPVLAYDIPFNEGLMRPVQIHAPSGTVCNAESPAPSSMASVGAVYAVTSVVVSALSQLVGSSPRSRSESQARTRGSFVVLNLGGRDQYDEPFGTMLLDGLAGGGGAFPYKDGLHTCGTFSMLEPNIANVETIESFAPILYVYRRLVQDSGGAGRQRGGLSLGFALTPHDVPSLDTILISHGVSVPNALGLWGGLPGGCTLNRLVRGSDLAQRYADGYLPTRLEELKGALVDLGPKPGRNRLGPGDVLESIAQGGGGLGDPLSRDPALVARDVGDGAVSREAAAAQYGVVMLPPSARGQESVEPNTGHAPVAVDIQQTAALRTRMRSQRIADGGRGAGPAERPLAEPAASLRIGDQLFVSDLGGARYVRCACGHVLGPTHENWRASAVCRRVLSAEAGPLLRLRGELELRAYCCPACGLQHAVDLVDVGSPALWDARVL
jgi:N-methylhydantoinase B